MSTTWSHHTVPNGATSPRSPGLDLEALEGTPSARVGLDLEALEGTPSARVGSLAVSVAGEVVEHPMTPEDVADLLRIDRETVYRMARRGQLPAFKVSSRWRFLPSHLQRWMEDQEGRRD